MKLFVCYIYRILDCHFSAAVINVILINEGNSAKGGYLYQHELENNSYTNLHHQ